MTVPTATYRVQLSPGFGFEDCRRRLRYLERLGVSHLYLSPVFEARAGSGHGYDVTDPRRVRGSLGGREGFERLSREASAHGLGVLIDIVPNHMAASHENPWWWEALRDGAGSDGARVFDIDWEAGGGRVVLPVLGAPLDEVLAAGDLRVDVAPSGERALRYFDAWFPLRAGIGGDATGADALRELLKRQHFELAWWREGAARRNYRRFFDIDHLVGVRVEDEVVFGWTHGLVSELWGEGLIDGVRVDHVDGLARPGEYLRRLRAMLAARDGEEAYLVVEKILEPGERLRDWPVAGTTGYDAMARITRLFVTRDGFEGMARVAAEAGVAVEAFDAMVCEAKGEVLEELFPGELAWLAGRASDPTRREPKGLARAFAAMCVACPRYRTYLSEGLNEDDRALIGDMARRLRGTTWDDDVRAVDELLAGRGWRDQKLVERFEQLTGPVMAKGLEDTAHYRHAVLTAMNEVGGHPVLGDGDAADAFHAFCCERAAAWPGTMNALSTHDTKRGEDARARILAIADAPEAWARVLGEAGRVAAGLRPRPAPEDLVFMLQAIAAVWPGDEEVGEAEARRLRAYMTKAVREGKRHSGWIEPDAAYEGVVCGLVDRIVLGTEGATSRAAIGALLEAIRARAESISLAQTVLRLTMPGVPDTYQGSEWENRSLVDPDNRGPVDFDSLEAALVRVEGGGVPSDWRARKLAIVRRLHELRRARRALFGRPAYDSIRADDPGVLAFRLDGEGGPVVVVVRVSGDGGGADRVSLRGGVGSWLDVLSGRRWEATGGGLEVGLTGVPAAVLVAFEG